MRRTSLKSNVAPSFSDALDTLGHSPFPFSFAHARKVFQRRRACLVELLKSGYRGSDHMINLRHVGSLPELGIWIKQALQGNGYGHEAITALIAWASERFEVAGFTWPVAVENMPSRTLAGKLRGTLVATFDRPKYAAVLYRIPALDTARGAYANRPSSTEQRLASKSSGEGKRPT